MTAPAFSRTVFLLSCLLAASGARAATPRAEVVEPAELNTLIAGARAALSAKDFARAVEQATRATVIAPESSEAWLLLGLAEFRSDHDQKGCDAFEKAVSLAPTSAVARFNLGSALFALQRYGEARAAFVAAAGLGESVAALALYNAGLCAVRQDQLGDAITLFQQAEAAARQKGSAALADKASEALESARQQRVREGYDRMTELARQGKEALHADHIAEARTSYQSALGVAGDIGADPGDRAELYFGLGCAELRADAYPAAISALDASTRLAPNEAAFHFMLAVASYRAQNFAQADAEFEAAQDLGLDPEDVKRADTYREILWNRRLDWQHYSFDGRATVGFDSNVPQSGTVIAVSPAFPSSQTAAPFVDADIDAQWRPLGDFHTGLFLEYRFNQLAYFAVPITLDPYSLQSNDLVLDGTWTPIPWLTLEADVDAFLMFAGIETFGPFEDGVTLGPKFTAREGSTFETTGRYDHTWQRALDPNYTYLTGSRDEATVAETARADLGRLTLAYRFRLQQVGSQVVSTSSLYFPCPAAPAGSLPCPPAAANVYVIPYSYQSHELSLTGVAYLPWSLRALASVRFDYRPYSDESYIQRPRPAGSPASTPLSTYYYRPRTDDITTIEASVSRNFGRHYSLELDYSILINASDVNNSVPSSRLDYDNENFVKQVIQLTFGISF